MSSNLLKIVHTYLKAIETNQTAETLRSFYHPQAVQIQYPNLLMKNQVNRNLDNVVEGFEKGKKIILKQTYEVVKSYESGNTVIIEAIWKGQIGIPIGTKAAGDEMKAYFAQFFQFEDDKIIRQRNYDCFEPF